MGLGYLHTRLSVRLAVLACAAVAAVAPTACGGGDDETSAATDAAPSPAQTGESPAAGGGKKAAKGGGGDGPALSGDPVEAKAAVESVDGVYEDFAAAVESGISATDVPARQTLDEARDNASLVSVCSLMSKAAKRQTIVYAKRSAGLADVEWSCENATGLLLRRASQTGGLKRSLRARVVGVNVEGDRATASVRFGGKGPISTVPLVKEDGKWKLGVTPSGGEGS